MKKYMLKLATAGVLLALNMTAFAQATLNVGENVVVTAINGQEIKTGLFSNPQRTFSLAPGKHVITAKYTHFYQLHGDNHDILRSSNISLPVELNDNQSYDLIMAGQPTDYDDAKQYVKQPTLALAQNNKILATQQATADTGTGIFSGLGNALGGIFGGGSKAVQANQQTIAALNNNAVNTVNTGTVNTNGTIPALSQPVQVVSGATSNAEPLDQFMQLWLKATPAEREKMRQWVQK